MSLDTFMFSDVSIRLFTIEDYEDVTALWKQAGLPYKPEGRDSKEKIAAETARDTSVFLVAEMNGKVIGTCLGTHDGRKGWINRVSVNQDLREKGIAQMLVKETEKRLNQKGVDIFACLIENWNDVSMEAFAKMGYIKHEDIIYFSKRNSPDV